MCTWRWTKSPPRLTEADDMGGEVLLSGRAGMRQRSAVGGPGGTHGLDGPAGGRAPAYATAGADPDRTHRQSRRPAVRRREPVRIREAPAVPGIPRLGADEADPFTERTEHWPTKKTTQASSDGWTAEERAAMKEHAAELQRGGQEGCDEGRREAQAVPRQDREDGPDPTGRSPSASTSSVTETAPDLAAKTWYGMPAYATGRQGRAVLPSRPASSSTATPPSASRTPRPRRRELWAMSFALTAWTPAVEKKIGALVKKAAG